MVSAEDVSDAPRMTAAAAQPLPPTATQAGADAAVEALKEIGESEDSGTSPDGGSLESELLPPMAGELGLSPLEVLPRWTGRLLLVLGFLTLPWIVALAEELPSRAEAAHYDVSWAGFDVMLCALLIRTGWSAMRKREHIELTAGMTGALLVVDAWFDVTSAATRGQFDAALAMALCVELPLAAFCLWIAGRVEFARRKRSERLVALVRRLETRRLSRVPKLAARRGRPSKPAS